MDDDKPLDITGASIVPANDPVCPHCGLDPAAVSTRGPIQISNMQCVVIYCANPNCRKIHAFQILAVQQPQIMPGALGRMPMARG